MNSNTSQRHGGSRFYALAVAMFLAAAAYVVMADLTVSELGDDSDDVPLLILGVAGSISLVGWWRDRVRSKAADQAVRHERERLESGLKDREEALDQERRLRSRLERAHQEEKNWRHELHAEMMRLYRERGSLGDPSDVPSMVLRLARTLLGAEKGMLLWREDEEDNGRLSLATAEGFDNDPQSSAIAQRFAEEVLERDQALREENPRKIGAEQSEGADEEIENLVAIPIYLQDEFVGVVVCANNPDSFDDYDDEVLLSIGDQAGTVLQNARLQGELRSSYLATVSMLADAMEIKDPFLRGHSEEVSGYVSAVADRFDLPKRRREELVFGSLLHDIGKIGISERILLKPGELTPEERSVIELHPRMGYQLVEQIPALRPISPAILYHHERYDGGGYPSGLRGDEIPLEARIICVADAFSAMISERPYRGRASFDDACAELERHAGTQFDPEVVRVFVEEVRRKPPISEQQDLAEFLSDSELETRREDEPLLGHATLALVDNLTLLYTRRYFHEAAHNEAQRAATRGRSFGVVIVELTEIAQLNWREGYAAGDEAIRAAARVVHQVAAHYGGTACRHGGNRLGLIFPDANEQTVRRFADEILVGLREGSSARVAAAAWRPGDSGEAVIARARAHLG